MVCYKKIIIISPHLNKKIIICLCKNKIETHCNVFIKEHHGEDVRAVYWKEIEIFKILSNSKQPIPNNLF